MDTVYRGRFAPSPTGALHFGSLVAAVGSYLEARTQGGEWLVRIEDVDRPRTVTGAADAILKTLEASGMHWDGTVMFQSARTDSYQAAMHELRREGWVYPCACSRREIADTGLAGIDGYVYPGTCRAGLPVGRPARAWRVRTQGARVAFDDAIQGHIEHDLEREVGDFVLLRADGLHAYQLAVVVDDAHQGITHVVRGSDLLGSTPRQIHLQRLLGLPRLQYAHLPVALDAQGRKLSKQTLAAPVDAGDIGRALHAALTFLGQPLPPSLKAAPVDEIWRWALDNWTLDCVPRVLACEAPRG